MKVVLRDRGFRYLLLGQTLSTLGDRALILAFGIWVKELTGSDAAAGVAFVFVAFPFLFAPFAGVVIDRFPRRQVFIATNLAMACVMLLSLAVHDASQVWLLYVMILCYGFSAVIITATQSALTASLFDRSELPDANGLLQTSGDGVKLLAPLLGAGLYTLVGGHVIALLDAATFLMAAFCVWRIKAPNDKRHVVGAFAVREELLGGLRHVFSTPALRGIVIALGLANLVTGFSQTLIFSIVGSGLHRTPAFVGILVSMQGAGAVAAGLSVGYAIRRLGDTKVVILGTAACSLASVLYLAPHIAPVVAGSLLFGAGMCWMTVALITSVQNRTPADMQGRSVSAAIASVSTPQTISIVVGAGVSLVVDYRTLLVAMAVVTGCSALWLTRTSARGRSGEAPDALAAEKADEPDVRST
ncbi:MFS transporter [Actinomadura kijaniata]|uniref:MFS transporter n=1 Tax=Actinomadura kijaniata TaxID=46161 RepID=UPI0028AB6F87|nr:MFS transporter [Actinomadura namibiensis]